MTGERAATWRSFSFPRRLICGNGFAAITRRRRSFGSGFIRSNSGKPSITWPESVDEALCVGWIDGIRKRIDAESYMIRFTPRRRGSIWSAVNIRRVEALTNEKRMQPAGTGCLRRAASKTSPASIPTNSGASNCPSLTRGLLRRNPEGVEVLPSPAPLLSQNDRLVGGEREAGRDAAQTAGEIDRGIGPRATPVPADPGPTGIADIGVAYRRIRRRRSGHSS